MLLRVDRGNLSGPNETQVIIVSFAFKAQLDLAALAKLLR